MLKVAAQKSGSLAPKLAVFGLNIILGFFWGGGGGSQEGGCPPHTPRTVMFKYKFERYENNDLSVTFLLT